MEKILEERNGEDFESNSLSDHLYLFEKNLPENFCRHLIERFQEDDRKHPGVTGGGVQKNVKDTTDINIILHEDWQEEKKFLDQALHKAFDKIEVVHNYGWPYPFEDEEGGTVNFYQDAYNMQEYIPQTIGYKWHSDAMCVSTMGSFRVMTYLWYINDIEDGGETEFCFGDKVKPKEGTLILFPCWPTFFHRGNPPLAHKKYIVTGWLYQQLIPDKEKFLKEQQQMELKR